MGPPVAGSVGSKPTFPTNPTSSCCCQRRCRSGCLTTIWPTSYPMWWTSWTCRRSPLATSGNGAAGRRIARNPRMMVKVLLYGYVCVGVASSRRIAQRLHEDIAFRVLAANNTPDFRTISDFRKDNVDALSGLFDRTGTGVVSAGGAGEAGARGAGRHEGQGQRIEA